MKILKQVVGIDIAKDELVCMIGQLDQEFHPHYGSIHSVANTPQGFKELIKWVKNQGDKDLLSQTFFVMEATGIYYESLAFFLNQQTYSLAVVVPAKVKHFSKSLEQKSKTDALDARVLAQLGLERKLKPWKAPSQQMRQIRTLVREYQALTQQITRTKNQLHAKEKMFQPPKNTLKRLKQLIKVYQKQSKQIIKELEELVKQDQQLDEKLKLVQTIPGVGFISAISIIGETFGFALIENAKQLVSYAGLDVMINQSGKTQRKTRISKKGNKHIRKALYWPAIAAIRHNEPLSLFYQRIMKTRTIKKIGITAVARKMLILIYTLWKNNEPFNPQYEPA